VAPIHVEFLQATPINALVSQVNSDHLGSDDADGAEDDGGGGYENDDANDAEDNGGDGDDNGGGIGGDGAMTTTMEGSEPDSELGSKQEGEPKKKRRSRAKSGVTRVAWDSTHKKKRLRTEKDPRTLWLDPRLQSRSAMTAHESRVVVGLN